MGGLAGCPTASAAMLYAVATCVPQADCHMALPAARQLATLTVCLLRISSCFYYYYIYMYIKMCVVFLSYICTPKLDYYFALISNFLRIILALFLFICVVIYKIHVDTYIYICVCDAKLMWRIMEPHSFSYAWIMQNYAHPPSPIRVNKLHETRTHIKQFAYQGPKPFWTAI